MWERIKGLFGGAGETKPVEETEGQMAAEYYEQAQAQAQDDPASAIRLIAFAAELDDSYRVRAIEDPAFAGLREDMRYQLVVTRRQSGQA